MKMRIKTEQCRTVLHTAGGNPDIVQRNRFSFFAELLFDQCVSFGGIVGDRNENRARFLAELIELSIVLPQFLTSEESIENFTHYDCR